MPRMFILVLGMAYRYLFGWAGGLIVLILAYGVFFAGPKGVTDIDGYNAYSLCGALMIVGAVLVSAAGQHKRVAGQSPPPAR